MAKITPRSKDYSQWYIDIVIQAKLADYSPVKGCMVIRPNGYAIWENLQKALDKMFKDTGHVNAYFPLFIPESFIHKEKEHIQGFSPELAVVTHAGGKDMEEPLVIRPTSETIIWSMYKNWIMSYRDLPMLINQWANVVRWELRTRLFLRTTEFLWQEGHTAHATENEAEEETLKILEVYRILAEEWMAMPVLLGRKTESEKFAGALRTYSLEAMMQDRKALQAGTSHNLGQNFAKAFDVTFQDADGVRKFVWATSWGVSTRLIGALIMAHSDDKGLVLPPRLAPIQIVIVPIWGSEDEKKKVTEISSRLYQILNQTHTVKLDNRDQYKPGWKFAEWELQGIPLRIEIGPKDVEKDQVVIARRDTGNKEWVPQDQVVQRAGLLLKQIQSDLFERARKFREDHIFSASEYASLKNSIDAEKGFIYATWCGEPRCEEKVKEETKATIRSIPFNQPTSFSKCVVCGEKGKFQVYFAKAY